MPVSMSTPRTTWVVWKQTIRIRTTQAVAAAVLFRYIRRHWVEGRVNPHFDSNPLYTLSLMRFATASISTTPSTRQWDPWRYYTTSYGTLAVARYAIDQHRTIPCVNYWAVARLSGELLRPNLINNISTTAEQTTTGDASPDVGIFSLASP